MTNGNSNSGREQPDPLSATGMFLRAVEHDTPQDAQPADPVADLLSPQRAPAAKTASAAPSAAASNAAQSEFTALFNSLPRSTPPGPGAPAASPATVQAVAPQPSPASAGQGEFTRIFVAGAPPAHTPVSRPSEDLARPEAPSAGPSRSKGFSSQGVSDSASADGFTQIFNGPPRPGGQTPPPRPAPASAPSSDGSFTQFFNNPGRGAAPEPAAPPAFRPAPPQASSSWNDDPIFSPPAKTKTPESAPGSVTKMIAALEGSGAGTSAPKAQETAPYRAEPRAAAIPATPRAPEDAGGVTRIIQQLAQESPAAAAKSAPMMEPRPATPASEEQGEFTRMISGPGFKPAPASPAGPQASSKPLGGAPAFAMPATPPLPPVPQVSPPALPAVVRAAAPAPAPAMAAPQAPALPAIPAIPKPAAPALPAIAPPKSKLEAMVPILLVINTFLLVLLLVVVIFLIKAK
jgi:hypothetical protein